MLNNANSVTLALDETPSRKRKREIYMKTAAAAAASPDVLPAGAAAVPVACFTNEAFSSTPKKIFARRRVSISVNCKENTNPNPFVQNPYLEVKSIANIVNKKQKEDTQKELAKQVPPTNPYEVVRKPPKKKKCEDACFENPALNLDIPEKQFNPYEVVRIAASPVKCFVNEALNLRGQDVPATLNPFEIQRAKPTVSENTILTASPLSSGLKIGLPFKPTIGCRIDFTDMSLSQLTPSKLLAEKLVFSPVAPPVAPKRSLGAITEETTMDIGKELDRYQLELENSINEAKCRKTGIIEAVEQPEQRIICKRGALTEISEAEEEQEHNQVDYNEKKNVENQEKPKKQQQQPVEDSAALPSIELANNDNADVAYASDSEDEPEDIDFKAPARFVRAYRPAVSSALNTSNNKVKAESKESLNSVKSNKSDKSDDLKLRGSHKVGNMIRKSIRRLMHPMQQKASDPAPDIMLLDDEKKETPSNQHHNNIMSSIRHSLRRRTIKANNVAGTPPPEEDDLQKTAEISIIDSSERVMKLKSNVVQTEYMKIEQLTNERKHTLRNSIRRSTREVMRHVFHKNQDVYTTQHH